MWSRFSGSNRRQVYGGFFFFFFVIIIVFIITATVPVIAVGFPIAKKKKLVPSRVQFNYTNFSSHSLGPTGTFPDMVKGLQ